MKIIKIQGGLGNQMFQYAHGRNLEHRGEKVIFDISFFHGDKPESDTPREFELDQFKIKTKVSFKINPPKYNLFKKILGKIGFRQECYWQNEKYFKNIINIIKDEFQPREPLSSDARSLREIINQKVNSISIHVRRGDNITNVNAIKYHGACDLNYYKKALSKILEMFAQKEVNIFVFSDDIEWSKNNIKTDQPIYFVSNPNISTAEEIYLMSLCKHNIIANSSFSWWGAWLNQNPNKIVIAPKQWMVHKTADELDILPKDWIQL